MLPRKDMDPTTQAAVVGALVSVVVTLAAAYPIAKITTDVEARRDRRAEFRMRLQEILSLAMEYPHLEHSAFCEGWASRDLADQKYWQYDIYCCMLFNLIEDVWKHTGGNIEAIGEIISYEEWLVCHRVWWTENQPPNVNGYQVNFYNFVETVVLAHNNSRQGART